MTGERMDIFKEMDELFAEISTWMMQDFTTNGSQVYDYRIIIKNSQEPSIPKGRANRLQTSSGPIAEVHRIGNEIKVVVELPGVENDSIRLDVQDDLLTIEANNEEIYYRTNVDIPPIEVESMQKSFKNSVLEVTFQIKKGK